MDSIDTPALIVDLQIVRSNIRRAQDFANQHNIKLRPHIKTHKLPLIAQMQLSAGATGINCQKITETESMLEGLGASIHSDVLITYNIIGKIKLQRLMNLLGQCDRLCVIVDSKYAVDSLAEALLEADTSNTHGKPLYVKIECDTGGLRAGVVKPAQAWELAQYLIGLNMEVLVFDGLMTFPAPHNQNTLIEWLTQAKKLFETSGIDIPAVSVGGTPDMWTVNQLQGLVTEMRPGTYVYNDRATMNSKAAELEWCAQTVLSTVCSRPTPLRAVCDAGTKALTSDLVGLQGFGYIKEYPNARISRISEEHGVIEGDKPEDLPHIGERIHIVPNHACVVTNLYDEVHLVENGEIVKTPIPARGKCQ